MAEQSNSSELSNCLNKFSLDLYQELSAQKDENIFVSPFSIFTGLSMCLIGSKETTELQLRNLLNLDNLDERKVLQLIQQLLSSINNNDPDLKFNTANKIYLNNVYELKPEFLDLIRKNFLSDAEYLDFKSAQQSAKIINDWVESKTESKIQNLVSPDSLNGLISLVLINAIYFNGTWLKQFDSKVTYSEDFRLRDGTKQKVDMMKMLNQEFEVLVEPVGLKALSCVFPYANKKFAMTIILPHDSVDIVEVEQELTKEKLLKLLELHEKQSFRTKINAYIPKFKLQYETELSESLSKLGAQHPFLVNKADFGRMCDVKGVCISKIIHKAVVEVNEKGTEAAAATYTAINLGCTPGAHRSMPFNFKCDHPFLFLIHGKQNRMIYFMGKYMKPV